MLEETILSNLLYNDEYFKKVVPYVKVDYFDDVSAKKIFESFLDYTIQYKKRPSLEALQLTLEKRTDLNESAFKEVNQTLVKLKRDEETDNDFLVNETEKFCQDRDLYNSIRKAILILDGQEKELDKGAIPKILSDSLSISFDTSVGHDFLENAEDRYEFYHRKEERVEFDLDIFNKITKGGFPKKSLNIFLASTGVGKSLVMCHMAAANLMHGKNVLYITLEMAEERISARIDANILGLNEDEIMALEKDVYLKRINKIKNKTTGKLIVKEYPTGSFNSNNLRYLLSDLKMKKGFVPDIIYLDYLNLCSSARLKGGINLANSYTVVKHIAEEMRGIAMEFNLPLVSATQTNRAGFDNSDISLTETSESIGLTYTADSFFAIISTDDLKKMGQIMFKQLKNRWNDINYYGKFLIGIDRSLMRLYNLEESAATNLEKDVAQVETTYKTVKKDRKKLFQAEGVS